MEKNDVVHIGSVAIILVNYNGYDDTERCLDSLLTLKYDNYHVYIVDNGSTDDSCDRLKKYIEISDTDKFELIESCDNLGFSGGNNIAINKALECGFEFVMLLNNDTIVTPDSLSILVKNSDSNSIITPRIMYWNNKSTVWYAGGKISKVLGRAWHEGIHESFDKNSHEIQKKVTFISGCCMLIPSNVIKKIGVLEEKYFLYYEDTEYCWRALNNNISLVYVGMSMIYHNVSSSTSKNSYLTNYYKIRNRLYLINDYVISDIKWIAIVYAYLEFIFGIIIKKYSFDSVISGVQDYKRKIIGKK